MNHSDTLEQIIKSHIHLNPPSSTGWWTCVHSGCGDRGHKGPRAAFMFTDDSVIFHCFNCAIKTKYVPSDSRGMSPTMQTILQDFGILQTEWQGILLKNLSNSSTPQNKNAHIQQNIEPNTIILPDHFYLLSDANNNDKWAKIANTYLQDRGIDSTLYPFMLSHPSKIKRIHKWHERIIIPIYKDDNLIFYQGRDLTNTKARKYMSSSTPKNKVLGGFERLFIHPSDPLYVVEGWFDAESINGVAIIGNELSLPQIEWLDRSPRQKVYIPDKTGDGQRAALVALSRGWNISTPDIGNCKDMNDAVNKYGKLYTMNTLATNTTNGFLANTNLRIYCEQNHK